MVSRFARRRGTAAIAVLFMVAGMTGCGGGQQSSSQSAVLRIGTSVGIDSLNPFVGVNQDDYAVWMHIYPTLLQYDTSTPNHTYMPSFATSWESTDGGKTLTFKTRPDAKWSDGKPLTAKDVAWTFNMTMKYKSGPTASSNLGDTLTSVEATDDNTLVAKYSEPSATQLYDLGTTVILPEQVWGQYAQGDGAQIKTYPNEPADGQPMVSGGPFVLTKYEKDDVALFARNPNWYGTKPIIDGFGLQTYQSEDAAVSALKTGELDAMLRIPPTSVTTLKEAGLTITSGGALKERTLIINSNPDKPNNRELLDLQVRKALEYAVNRQEIVNSAWLGHATAGSALIPPAAASNGQKWHDDSLQPLPFDTAKANQILDGLGYRKGPDGIRLANGHPMDYKVIFANDQAGAGDRAFQIIQGGFAEIGVKLTMDKLDVNAAYDALYCGADCAYRDFDMAMWDWDPSKDPDFQLAAMTCNEWGSWNDSGYCSKPYDALYQRQRRELDPSKRKGVIDEMQRMLYEDRPYVILSYDDLLDATSSKWEGFVQSPQGFFNDWSTQSLESVHPK